MSSCRDGPLGGEARENTGHERRADEHRRHHLRSERRNADVRQQREGEGARQRAQGGQPHGAPVDAHLCLGVRQALDRGEQSQPPEPSGDAAWGSRQTVRPQPAKQRIGAAPQLGLPRAAQRLHGCLHSLGVIGSGAMERLGCMIAHLLGWIIACNDCQPLHALLASTMVLFTRIRGDRPKRGTRIAPDVDRLGRIQELLDQRQCVTHKCLRAGTSSELRRPRGPRRPAQ